jgi:AcrR family transcriptional regulator
MTLEEGDVPARRTQQQRREETKAKLIAAAFDLVRDYGAASLTTAKVAKAAGLTRGAIQYHFSSPKDLLREVVVQIVNFLSEKLEEENLGQMDKDARLSRIVDVYWNGYRSDIYEVFIELTVQGRLDPDFSQTIKEALITLEKERDDQWLGLFLDYDQSDAQKIRWRSSLLVILRGLALKQMFTESEEEITEIFLYAKEAYIQNIQYQCKNDV